MSEFFPPLILELRAKAGELYGELGKVKGEVGKMASETEAKTSRMQTAFHGTAAAGKAITFGVVGAGVAIAGFGVEAGMAAEVVDARLRVAIKNAGGSMEEMEPKVSSLDSKMRGYGFTNDQTNSALATLTTSLKDPAKAMSVMSVAADLAKAKNIDLNSAALLVAKGMEGQTRPLKALGIDLPVYTAGAQNVKLAQIALATAQDNVNKILAKTPDAANAASKAHGSYEKAMRTASLAQEKLTETQNSGDMILKTLTERVKGGAAAFGDTFRGKIASAKAGLEDMGEKIGKVLIPIILNVIKVGQQWADYLGKHKPLLIAIAAIIGGPVLVAIGAYIVSMVSAAIATIAAMWPILLIIAAIGLLVAAILWLVNNWSAVVKFVTGMWANVGSFFKTVGDAIVKWWTDFWSGIINFAVTIFTAYVTAISSVFNGIVGFFRTVGGAIGTVWNSIWTGLGNMVKNAFNGIVDFVKGIFNAVIDIVNGIIGTINGVLSTGKVIGINLQIPKLPHFDVGTDRVPGATGAPLMAVVHGGEPILSNDMMAGRKVIPSRVVDAVNAQQGSASPAGATTQKVTVIAQTNASPQRIASEVGWVLRGMG